MRGGRAKDAKREYRGVVRTIAIVCSEPVLDGQMLVASPRAALQQRVKFGEL